MDYKKDIRNLLAKLSFLKENEIAKAAGIDPSNFNKYVSDNDVKVSEKTYLKIKSSIEKLHAQFSEAIKITL